MCEERHLWWIMMRRMPVWLFAWWGLCAAWALRVRLNSPGILEGGDGVHHFQIARYAWKHPELLLDIWGKPLFTLFSSPFAQLGHWGMVLFNVLCLVATAWAADGVLRKAGIAARLLFAPFLLFTPVYGTMVLAGMTEVFFGLLTVVVLRLLWDQRYGAAMLVASFMPFARPEYVAFVPFAFAWVAYQRQWKALPFILTGHLIYGIIGTFVHKDPLWVFHHDPYTGAADIYGHGEPLHFVSRIKEMFGAPLMWAMAVALVAAPWLWVNDRTNRAGLKLLLVVGVLPALGILTLHSLLWWKGWKGSLGLLRVMATAAPLLVLCAVWPVGVASNRVFHTWQGRLTAAFVLGLFLLRGQYASLVAYQPLPVPQQTYEPFLQRVGERIAEMKDKYTRLVCFHPQIPFRAGIDPFDLDLCLMGWKPDPGQIALGLRSGDLMVWDAHFGPNEGNTALEPLLVNDSIQLVDLLVPPERLIMLGGRPFEVFFFRRGELDHRSRSLTLIDAERGVDRRLEHRLDTAGCSAGPGRWCFQGTEFPLAFEGLSMDTLYRHYTEVRVTGALETTRNRGDLKLVLEQRSNGDRTGYWSQDLEHGALDVTFRVEPSSAGTSLKLYLWNTAGSPFATDDLLVQMTCRGLP